MTSSALGVSNEQQEILDSLDRWTKAFEAKDVETMLSRMVDDVVVFDCKPPLVIKDVKTMRQLWEQCLPHFPEKFKSERKDLKIVADGNLAFMHSLHRIVSLDDTPEKMPGIWLRITVCYQKIEGQWRVIHEHISAPFDPATGQAVFITDADAL